MPTVAATPWLVGLDDHRFVRIAVATDRVETSIRPITWTGEVVRLGARKLLARRIDDAGTADVDGDGRPELVLAEANTRRRGPTCQGTTLLVLDPLTLDVLAEHRVPNIQLASGAIGPLDEVPGDDLVGTAFANCPAAGAAANRLLLAAVRLGDGHQLFTRRLDAADTVSSWSGRPAVVDLERDRRPEVVIGSSRGALVVRPQLGWAVDTLTALPGVLVGVRDAVGSRRSGAVVVVRSRDAIEAAHVRPSGDGWVVDVAGRVDSSIVGADAWAAAMSDARSAALRLRGGPAWLDGPGACSPLVLALAVLPCWPPRNPPSLAEAALLPGPAWLATRPLARAGPPGSPLLVARSDAWPGAPARLGPPAPLAAEPSGASWRHGPSGPFTLAEVAERPGGLRATPLPVVEAGAPAEAPEIVVRAPSGSRVLVAVAPATSPAAAEVATAGLPRLLASARRGGLDLSLNPLEPGPAGRASASATPPGTPPSGTAPPGTAPPGAPVELRLPLRPPAGDPPANERSDAPAWQATVIAIGPLGHPSAAVRARLSFDRPAPPLDRTAPVLELERPFLTAPWPLTTTLVGSTEPGARVLSGGRAVSVRPDGTFDVAAVLPPWPERVELRAVDAAGNEQVVRADLVGGLDYRRLPWEWLLAASLIVAAALGGRGAGRRAQPRAASGSDALNVIEEVVPPRRIPPR